MGTSTSNKGPNGHTPLVPSWLESDNTNQSAGVVSQPGLSLPIPQNADENRFRGPRTSFTHYANSSGRDVGSAKRGISNYISRSLGGSRNALQHLGSARGSTARLHGVLNILSSGGGVQAVARILSLDNLERLPAKLFFIRIAEFICPDGGPNDEGLARSAYFDVISEPELAGKTTEELTKDDCESVLKNMISRVITQKIENDIARQILFLPGTVDEVSQMEDTIRQMIRQDVSDAMTEAHASNQEVTSEFAQETTDKIYQSTFALLEGLGD